MESRQAKVVSFSLKAGYPNTYAICQSARNRAQDHNPGLLWGYTPPLVECRVEGEDAPVTLNVRLADLRLLIRRDQNESLAYLSTLLCARRGSALAQTELSKQALALREEAERFFKQLSIHENAFVVPSVAEGSYEKSLLSEKGETLLGLARQGYPIPDFSILTSECQGLNLAELEKRVSQALCNLEMLTGQKLGDSHNPLLFALRDSLPICIPGLMPTYLNIGATLQTVARLAELYGKEPAAKVFLNNLKNIYSLLNPTIPASARPQISSLHHPREIEATIDFLSTEIHKKDPSLLTDAHRQVLFFVDHARRFFEDNIDLIYTFTRGKRVQPAQLLQKMVYTAKSERSYPGVLHSRHPRHGRGRMIESVRAIFGEEIMTGSVEAEVDSFHEREDIRERFPAVYYFAPSLDRLERQNGSAVTVEFAAEEIAGGDFIALIQLNRSEMTGQATLLSAIDMYREGVLSKSAVASLVSPLHLKQLSSERVDERSFEKLEQFCEGQPVLPRGGAVARIYFTATDALEAKKRGEKVCYCKKNFHPTDSLVMAEVDAIMSLTPAAIHVVTTCRNHGVPAFLNLEKSGVSLAEDGQSVENADNLRISRGEWVTLSSRRQQIFRGQADMTPSFLQRDAPLPEQKHEEFETRATDGLREAFDEYQQIVAGLEAKQIEHLADLIKLVRNDLRGDDIKANHLVNEWYDTNTAMYVDEVLEAEIGSHLDNHRIYSQLALERRIDFYRRSIARCREKGLSGLNAGAFMLGRFLCRPHPMRFWSALDESEIAFALNEWILFEKYMAVLNDVGERRINRARQMLTDKRLGPIRLRASGAKQFITLKLSCKSLPQVANQLMAEHDKETFRLVSMLQQPYSFFYDYAAPWSLAELEKICEEEKVKLPQPEDA